MKFSGFVVQGDGEGTPLGFPTANLDVVPELDPGVYAVWVTSLSESLAGVLCVGGTGVDGAYKCEVHLLDFSGNLYGASLDVEVVGERISEIQSLSNQEELRKKIQHDIDSARIILKR